MKKQILLFIMLMLFQTSFSQSIKVGSQEWMVSNLDVIVFRNGDTIKEAKTEKEWVKANQLKKPAWCYLYNNPSLNSKFGKLYNWYAVNDPRGLGPIGWHVPNEKDWNTLINYLGGDSVAGRFLKDSTSWEDAGYSGNGMNTSGFSAKAGIGRDCFGDFFDANGWGWWWSATSSNLLTAYTRIMSLDYDKVDISEYDKGSGLSVRCVRDYIKIKSE